MSTLVIADNVEADRQFIALRAQRLGFDLQVAGNGKDAMDLCRRLVPRVLIVSSEIGGLRVCSSLRAASETASIHMVLSTPQDELATTKTWGDKHGVNDYLVKPLGERVTDMLKPFMDSRDTASSQPAPTSGVDSRLLREIGQSLATHLSQPVDIVMRLFIAPEVKKLGVPFEQITSTEHDALLQRLSMRIVSRDGKRRQAFLEEARRLR